MVGENHVAFHDTVTLLGWSESSSRGPTIKVGLASRQALSHFDTATRRRGKRAGQRYHAAISTVDQPPHPLGAIELWFAGANWAHQDGARVTFSVAPDDMEFFRGHTTRDQDAENAFMFWLTLVEIDDDERPVVQAQAEEPLKGGPNSKNVAMLCHSTDFQWYVAKQEGLAERADFVQADAFVKRICGIKSKVELDHNDEAWDRFINDVRRPFFEWGRNGG